MTLSSISSCVLVLQFAVISGQQQPADAQHGSEYDAAYKKGIFEADKEWEAGEATIYVYGTRELGEFIHRNTGLRYKAIAGCVADEAIEARAAGHNQRIKELITNRGLPKNSFKPWEKELFDLKSYYDVRIKTEKPFRLTVGGKAATSPDGKYEVRLIKRPVNQPDGTTVEFSSLVVVIDGNKEGRQIRMLENEMDCIWGPKNSGFALVRISYGKKDLSEFKAVDLIRGEPLRKEFHRDATP